MKKVISVVGARPNFMKVAPIHRAFEKYPNIEHFLVHTGQHYDKNMSDAFFQDLEMPHPKHFLSVGSGSHAEQTAKVMIEFEKILIEEKPDLVIVVGDVNSTVACSLTAVKLHIPVAHVESGLRSGDREMPEEINRLVTDSICDIAFVTEESGKRNLLKEDYPEDNIHFVGNTMIDSQHFALQKLAGNNVLERLGLTNKGYVLSTVHRPSNVDNKQQMSDLLDIFDMISKRRTVVIPMHPRTKKNIDNFGLTDKLELIENLVITEPLGYLDFLNLMKNCDFVMTDSGGIQEETTALGVDCITIRTTTERPSTIELGTNILVQPNKIDIENAVNRYLSGDRKSGSVPYLWDGNAAERIAEVISNRLSESK
jgi:UDP-N-acetylglucosamine 2-epimerase (non-hydrolysing)